MLMLMMMIVIAIMTMMAIMVFTWMMMMMMINDGTLKSVDRRDKRLMSTYTERSPARKKTNRIVIMTMMKKMVMDII